MKLLYRFALINLFCFTTLTATADSSDDLVKYLLNLGGYLGYNLQTPPTNNNQTISQTLIDADHLQLAQSYMFYSFLGAIPVASFKDFPELSNFLPSKNGDKFSSAINDWANATFKTDYSSQSSQQSGKVSVNTLIDQQTFQQDPVSQSVLNILATPDYSFCLTSDGNSWDNSCNLLYETKVSANVIGPLPTTQEFFTYDYNKQFLSQLNSNVLTAPLMYSTENPSANTTGSPNPNSKENGLTALSPAQQAENFIRYVSGAVTPPTLPSYSGYQEVIAKALSTDTSQVSEIDQKQAQATLTNYFANLRTYAAQSSVGMSNLYYIMSKRMPQSQSTDNQIQTSQAENEFKMATWRLDNPETTDEKKKWINQINNASSATVEKEIAVLLAEINYQMYLDRQIQERILLTNTIMLMQNTKASQPLPDFSSKGSPGAGSNEGTE